MFTNYIHSERKDKHKEAAFQKAVNDAVSTQLACIPASSKEGRIIKVNSSGKPMQARTKRKASVSEAGSSFERDERAAKLEALKAETEAKTTQAKREKIALEIEEINLQKARLELALLQRQ
jgi:hypothetical protein